MQVAGHRVAFGMRGEAAPQRAAEIARPGRLQFIGELVGQRARLNRRQSAPADADDVRIGGEIPVIVDRATCPLFAERLGHGLGPDPPVAIPLGPAVA